MSDNLDDFLERLGIESPPNDPIEITTTPVVHDPERSAVANGDLPPEAQSLSTEDFDNILEDYGFTRPQNVEAEEVHDGSDDAGVEDEEEEENTEEYDENGGEGGDLDAEEDADWQEAIDSGSVVPVVGPDGQRVQITEEVAHQINAAETTVEDNVYFHMPDGEVITVPIIHEGEQEPSDFDRGVIPTEQLPAQEPLIPLNSPTLLMDESTTRFSGAEWFNEIQSKSIILAGLGGIGSWLSLQLARMVPTSMALYDPDTVEVVNMAGQLYSSSDIGKSKVTAVHDMISKYTNMHNIFSIQDRFTENTEAGDIMMCGFDNMEARKTFIRSWIAHIENKTIEEKKKCLFLDGRLSMNVLQVFCMTGDDGYNIRRYVNEFLFSDAEAEETVCSMKQTTYLVCMIGSIMTNLFTNWCANLIDPIIPYDLPFFTEYDAQNMIFKTIK